MNTFADYILNEEDLDSKMEIAYYLSKKAKIFFDKSVIFKTEILRLFLNYSKISIDTNMLLTASLLCNCKKINNAQELEKIRSYAKEGAKYLKEIGFGNRFCKICEEVNRYSNSNPREKESDILELVDQFGGMLLDRPERIGFKPDEALVLLEHRNLKDQYNRYLGTFIEFVNYMEEITINDKVAMPALKRLTKIHNETDDVKRFIQKVVYEFEPIVDKKMQKTVEELTEEIIGNIADENRPLFSIETTRKIIGKIDDSKLLDIIKK